MRGSTVKPVMENDYVLYTPNLLVIYKPCHSTKRSQITTCNSSSKEVSSTL